MGWSMQLWRALVALALAGPLGLFAAACIDHPDAPPVPDGSGTFPPASGNPQNPAPPGTPGKTDPPGTNKDPKSILTEVVYVLMDDFEDGHWMCTGTLVAKDRVVTAAHCIDEGRFHNWSVVAPLIASKPRVKATAVALFSYDYESIENPDIGFLRLEEAITAPTYATLVDVTANIEKGEKVEAVAIVREKEEFEAPFKSVPSLPIKSATGIGYDHGFSTPLFSHGGDSGAGLFLVENGQVTHKLIAVARQPEPETKLDHLTRIDAEILDWFNQNLNGGE
jgi:hypothetical protein